jgi:hypothetical protein
MLIKTLIVMALIAILISLGSGMVFLLKDKGQTERTAKALTVRIVLSVSLFGLLMLGVFTGHIKPHGIYPTASAPLNSAP